MKILYIEDSAIHQRMLRRVAASLGCELVVAADGAQGYRLAQAALDLILLDINLPDTNGLALVRRLRSENIQTPIIAVTGDVITNTRHSALEAGCNDFIAKPFEPEMIGQMIRQYWV